MHPLMIALLATLILLFGLSLAWTLYPSDPMALLRWLAARLHPGWHLRRLLRRWRWRRIVRWLAWELTELDPETRRTLVSAWRCQRLPVDGPIAHPVGAGWAPPRRSAWAERFGDELARAADDLTDHWGADLLEDWDGLDEDDDFDADPDDDAVDA